MKMYTTQTQIYKCTYLRVRDYGALTLISCLVTFLDDLQRARRIQMYSHPHMHQQYQIVAAFETHYNEISLINKKKNGKGSFHIEIYEECSPKHRVINIK